MPTPTKADLLALAERVEGATEPSRELDEAVHAAVFPDDPWWQAMVKGREMVAAGRDLAPITACGNVMRASSWAVGCRVASYTTSLDAALSLYPTKPDTIPTCPRKATGMALRARAASLTEVGHG